MKSMIYIFLSGDDKISIIDGKKNLLPHIVSKTNLNPGIKDQNKIIRSCKNFALEILNLKYTNHKKDTKYDK